MALAFAELSLPHTINQGGDVRVNRTLLTKLSVCIFTTMNAMAAEIYVSPQGNNTNRGDKSFPVKTITRASQLARPGDVVYVAPGVYNENVITRTSGEPQARIKFISEKKWGAQIIGSGTEAMWSNHASYVDIVNFDISGPGRLGLMNLGSYVLMSGNHIHDIKVSGGCTGGGGAGIVNANYSGSDGDIIGNVVHDIGTRGACNGVQGIYSSNLRGKISNNIVYRASSFGIHLWHAANNVLISNNTVFANGSARMGGGIVIGAGDSPGGIVLDNTKVVNNIVYDNPASSITQYCYPKDDCIGNNNLISNNLVFKNGMGISLKKGQAIGTISAEPQFVNYLPDGKGDYHLLKTSPAIDKGILAGAPAFDLDGNLRAGLPDIGALEYKSPSIPIASFSSSSLGFKNTLIGSNSSESLKLTNAGNASLILKALTFSGEFTLGSSSKCLVGTKLDPGQSCVLEVLFSPKSSGSKKGTLVVETNASPSSSTIALEGLGELPKAMISLSTSSLNFGKVDLGSSSASQLVIIKNSGQAPLVFPQGFTMSSDFSFGGSGSCKVNVAYAPGQSCTASVVFKPKVLGQRSGVLTIISNATNSLQTVSLVGEGINPKKPIASVSIKEMNFGNVKIGMRSVVKIVTITNSGTGPLSITEAFSISGPFAFGGSGTCSVNGVYGPGQKCTASVIFLPKKSGLQSGELLIKSNASPVAVILSGNGIR